MDDFSCVSVLHGEEAKEQKAAMESWKASGVAANAQPLLAKTSDGKEQVVEIVSDIRGEDLVNNIQLLAKISDGKGQVVEIVSDIRGETLATTYSLHHPALLLKSSYDHHRVESVSLFHQWRLFAIQAQSRTMTSCSSFIES